MSILKNLTGAGMSGLASVAINGSTSGSLTATGTNQATAYLLSADRSVFTTVASGTGAILTSIASGGDTFVVVNNGANALSVYPPTGGTIGNLSANTAYVLNAGYSANFEALTATAFTVTAAAGADGTAIAGTFTTVTANAIAGGDSSLGITGQAAAQGGAVVVTGGTSSTAANAGGAVSIVGGTGGATGVGGAVSMTSGAGQNVAAAGTGSAAGAASVVAAAGGTTATGTGGAGGDVAITAGAGGNASGAGTGGAGGTIIITPGTGGTTVGGTAGKDGVIIERGVKLVKQGAPTAKTVSATLTASEVLAGIITVNQAAGASSAQQLPEAADMDTALPDAAAGDAFDFSVINTSTVDAEDASVTTNTGWTLVGNMDIHAYSAAGSLNSSGRFRARKTGAGAWTLYRIS